MEITKAHGQPIAAASALYKSTPASWRQTAAAHQRYQQGDRHNRWRVNTAERSINRSIGARRSSASSISFRSGQWRWHPVLTALPALPDGLAGGACRNFIARRALHRNGFSVRALSSKLANGESSLPSAGNAHLPQLQSHRQAAGCLLPPFTLTVTQTRGGFWLQRH